MMNLLDSWQHFQEFWESISPAVLRVCTILCPCLRARGGRAMGLQLPMERGLRGRVGMVLRVCMTCGTLPNQCEDCGGTVLQYFAESVPKRFCVRWLHTSVACFSICWGCFTRRDMYSLLFLMTSAPSANVDFAKIEASSAGQVV